VKDTAVLAWDIAVVQRADWGVCLSVCEGVWDVEKSRCRDQRSAVTSLDVSKASEEGKERLDRKQVGLPSFNVDTRTNKH